ncbi:MAG: HAMP domain-containing sensor histidine kinase [Bacteroidota bacterium]
MKINKLNIVIVLGLTAIAGILAVQLLWTKQAFNVEEKKFSQKAHIALLHVVNKLYEYSHNEYPLKNPINKVSNDYYVVNVNNDFDASVLEYCLRTEFEKSNLITDFEYAIYKCESDEMVYGNYISFTNKAKEKRSVYFPKQKNLVYYFAIRFPNENNYLFSSLKFWFVLSAILIIILVIYVYSIFTIIQQRKYSELQKDFINNMTHEFKTPLSSILIASNYLIKQEKISSDEKLEKYTGIIITQSNKLNDHIEKILNIARSDNAPLALEKKPVSVLPVINNVIENITLKYTQVRFNVISEKDYTISADEFHLNNILYNLIDNSIKYCEEDPFITIRLSEEGKFLKLEFTDNGIGIPVKKLPYIFDKFYRIPGNKSNEVNGFGIGLYYVKKISDLHHWKVSATNNTSKGITITLLIPQ